MRSRFAFVGSFVILVVFRLVAHAQFTYETNSGTITVTKYTGPGGTVTIPTMIDGLPVTSIGNKAFMNNTAVTAIVIPDTVNDIQDGVSITQVEGAFQGCTNLTTVTLGNNLTRIGDFAFSRCKSLAPLSLPTNLITVGWGAFYGCDALREVTFPGSVKNIGNDAFGECKTLTTIIIPNSVTNIGALAFYRCPSLRCVTIPDSVVTLGEMSFQYCSSLTNVVLSRGLTTILHTTWGDCTLLSEVTIPASVSSISNWAFSRCTDLRAARFAGDAPQAAAYAFYGSSNAVVYYLPGTAGWGPTFAGRPTALWLPEIDSNSATFGIHNNQFTFTIKWASDMTTVVDACTNLAYPEWFPVTTNVVSSGGTAEFRDPEWINAQAKFYRIRWP